MVGNHQGPTSAFNCSFLNFNSYKIHIFYAYLQFSKLLPNKFYPDTKYELIKLIYKRVYQPSGQTIF